MKMLDLGTKKKAKSEVEVQTSLSFDYNSIVYGASDSELKELNLNSLMRLVK